MELRILGSGTCDPSPDRGCAGYLLKIKGKSFLIDAGPGTHRALAKEQIDFNSIDEFFISHFHLDHVNDLPAILFSRKHCISTKPKEDILIHGPEGFKKSFTNLLEAYENQILTEDFNVEILEHLLEEGEEEIESYTTGEITVKMAEMDHSYPAIGYRFEYNLEEPEDKKAVQADGDHKLEEFDGSEKRAVKTKSLTYSGDTSPCRNIVTLARNSDALLMEAAMPDESPRKGHTTTSEAAATAKKANVNSLILTHLSPENANMDLVRIAGKVYKGIIITARDGLRLSI